MMKMRANSACLLFIVDAIGIRIPLSEALAALSIGHRPRPCQEHLTRFRLWHGVVLAPDGLHYGELAGRRKRKRCQALAIKLFRRVLGAVTAGVIEPAQRSKAAVDKAARTILAIEYPPCAALASA
ncbi:MAG: hypothetical protein JXR83_15520 [Deltaproteobacteria bacterium]|nr:hypothetical protein [Deltaproteobacteria bacterium]